MLFFYPHPHSPQWPVVMSAGLWHGSQGGGHGHARPPDPWSFVVDETVAMASRGRVLEWQDTFPGGAW